MVWESVGTGRHLQEIGGLEINAANVSPTSLGLGKSAGVPGLNLHSLELFPAKQVLGAWREGGGWEKRKRDLTSAPEERWVEGRCSHAWRGPVTVRG